MHVKKKEKKILFDKVGAIHPFHTTLTMSGYKRLIVVKTAKERWPHKEFPEDVGKIRTAFHVLNLLLTCFYCTKESCQGIQIKDATAWIPTCDLDICQKLGWQDRDKLEPYFKPQKEGKEGE